MITAHVQEALDQVRGAWRFRWVALATAWGVCIAAWMIIFLLPDTYRASARVFVDTDTELSKVTRGISIGSDVETQIQRVRQALLGAPELQQVANKTGLGASAVTQRDRQLVLEDLRKQIDISADVTGNRTGVYIISYDTPDRALGLRVVQELLNAFVENALGGERQGSQQAQQFLKDQIADYERRLTAAEARLAEFKKRNVGLMPGAQGDYFERLQAETEALASSEASLRVAAQKRDELARQLKGEKLESAGNGDDLTAAALAAGAGSATAKQIQEVRSRLDDLLLRYTDKHPDVIALRQTLRGLEARQAEELAALRRGDASAAANSGLAANPVFQSIQLQYNQTEVQIAELRAEVAGHQNKVARLRGLVNTAPEVEAELKRLNRDYEVTKAQYEALVQRLEAARLGNEADATGLVQFQVIDPPSAGYEPVAPKRPKLLVVALLAGLACGAFAAYFLHMIRPVFSSVRQLSEATGLPVLGEVSMTWLERFTGRRRRQVVVVASGAVGLVVVAILLLLMEPRILAIVKGGA